MSFVPIPTQGSPFQSPPDPKNELYHLMPADRAHSLDALDALGTTAAVYPSEDQLWAQGPPINAPGSQGLAGYGDDPQSAGGTLHRLPAPRTEQEARAMDEWNWQQQNMQTPNGAYGEDWVNLQIGGPAGYGNLNEQPYYSGHTQIVQANPAAEQGWGVGPARRWAHYPFSELGNPWRDLFVHKRDGQLPWVTASSSFYERMQEAWEQQWAPYKQRNPVAPVVNVPPSVPFVQTVPTFGGGDVLHPGVGAPAMFGQVVGDGAGIYPPPTSTPVQGPIPLQ